MQIDGGLFEITMPQQHLDSTQIRARFKQMRGKAVAQRVRMHIVRKAGLPRSSFASMVDHFGGDGVIAGMTTLAIRSVFVATGASVAGVRRATLR